MSENHIIMKEPFIDSSLYNEPLKCAQHQNYKSNFNRVNTKKLPKEIYEAVKKRKFNHLKTHFTPKNRTVIKRADIQPAMDSILGSPKAKVLVQDFAEKSLRVR